MYSLVVHLSLLALFSGTVSAAIGPVADLTIDNAVISPDGYSRSSVLAGGTFPGPVISGNKGDRFQLNVVNKLHDTSMLRSTSVHWHGIFQQGSNWADGAAFINQCPIPPGDSFLYDFSVHEQAGTFWYHSHLSTQYCDGLRGAFIVRDPADPYAGLYDVDDDSTVISLADWYHTPAPHAMILGKAPPFSDATLINGKGRYIGGPRSPLSVINVQQGKRYRLRIINMSCDPNFIFSIDNHRFLVIEADGVNTQPQLVDSIQIFAGQRYSAILNANQTVGNYWVRAKPNNSPPGFLGGINTAILRYAGAPAADPTASLIFPPRSVLPLRETDLHPLTNPAAPGLPFPGGADVRLNLQFSLNLLKLQYEVNGVTFAPPTVPVLLQILSGAQAAQDLLPKGSVYPLPPNKVIEVSMPGHSILDPGIPHPFHLHGHVFSVVRSANSPTYNFANPVQRDTVNVGGGIGSNTTIRFVTDNAGPWFLHCHIDWHLEMGLAVVFAEDIGGTSLHNPVPESWNQLCPAYDALPAEHP